MITLCVYQDSVAGPVIQASGMVLFEDALKAGILSRGKSLLELWVTTFLLDLQPPLIFV